MYDGYSCRYGGECFCCGDCVPADPIACSECGAEVKDADALRNGLCPDCQASIKKKFADLLIMEFSQEELELIDDSLDGMWLVEFLAEHVTPSRAKQIS